MSSPARSFARRSLCSLLFAVLLLVLMLPAARAADGTRFAQPRVIGGTTVPDDPGEWPFIVALLSDQTGDSYDDQYCGGTLIRPDWVLTAAHCPDPSSVLVGTKTLGDYSGEWIPVTEVIAHAGYDSETKENDIMLVRLAWDAEEGTPIALAEPGSDPAPGTSVEVAGWGDTDPDPDSGSFPTALQEATVEVASNSACQIAYDIDAYIAPSMLCASHFTPTPRDTCQGDSGGPLVHNAGSGLRLVGITSWGYGCAEDPFPGVYTRVSHFRDWISAQWRELRADSSDLWVGSATVGQASAPVTASFTSSSEEPVAVSYVFSSSSDFKVVSDGCSGAVIAPGASCAVGVVFSPSYAGYFTGELSVVSDEGSNGVDIVSLSGVGEAARASLSVRKLSRFKRSGSRVSASFRASYRVPSGTAALGACDGSVTLRAKVTRVGSARKVATLRRSGSTCTANFKLKLPARARGRKATVTATHSGNSVLNPFSARKVFKVR